jgi:hypothetical protein
MDNSDPHGSLGAGGVGDGEGDAAIVAIAATVERAAKSMGLLYQVGAIVASSVRMIRSADTVRPDPGLCWEQWQWKLES